MPVRLGDVIVRPLGMTEAEAAELVKRGIRVKGSGNADKPRRTPRKQAESSVLDVCRDFLETMGWRCFRHRNTAIAMTERGPVPVKGRDNDAGLGDLLAFAYPWMMSIETKRPDGGRLKDSQKAVFADPRVAPFCLRVKSLETLRAEMAARGIPERAPKP